MWSRTINFPADKIEDMETKERAEARRLLKIFSSPRDAMNHIQELKGHITLKEFDWAEVEFYLGQLSTNFR